MAVEFGGGVGVHVLNFTQHMDGNKIGLWENVNGQSRHLKVSPSLMFLYITM